MARLYKRGQGVRQAHCDLQPRTRKHRKNSRTLFIIQTTAGFKHDLDKQVVRLVFATTTLFRAVEHLEFATLMNMLRPGYKPPSQN